MYGVDTELLAIGITLLTPLYVYAYRTDKAMQEIKTKLASCRYCREATKNIVWGDRGEV